MTVVVVSVDLYNVHCVRTVRIYCNGLSWRWRTKSKAKISRVRAHYMFHSVVLLYLLLDGSVITRGQDEYTLRPRLI